MTTIRAVQGDHHDVRRLRLDGIEDLADVSAAVVHVWRKGDTHTTLTASVADPTARTVEVNLGGPDGWLASAAPGGYLLEVQLTAGVQVLTWPSGQPVEVHVRAQGDAHG